LHHHRILIARDEEKFIGRGLEFGPRFFYFGCFEEVSVS